MEDLKQALQYIAQLGVDAENVQVVEINGKTYANKGLNRYDKAPKADPITASTLSSMVDYIRDCHKEFPEDMIIHIISPKKVRLMSGLDREREREVLFETNAVTSEFRFDEWYDQERFMIELQANFQENDDLTAVKRMAGNIDKKNAQEYSDDGTTQVATITVGVATKADALVPNPVSLIPFRTFQEVAQPDSKFVFRISDRDVPMFKIVEAEGGIWKNEAISHIKSYFNRALEEMPEEIAGRITVIG